MNNQAQSIFRAGSTTYYFSSLFFPEPIRSYVADLYAFVRTADDYVDCVPPQKNQFQTFKKLTFEALKKNRSPHTIIDRFIKIKVKFDIPDDWIKAFLRSMEQDLQVTTYESFDDLEAYMYGSAEVIGMMLCKVFKVDEEALHIARLQGKAMQIINFIRDIDEDRRLGRTYLPQEDLKAYGIERLSPTVSPATFGQLIRMEIQRYFEIQTKADAGHKYLPKNLRIPVATASALYNWTAKKIYKNPSIVWEKKVKPSKYRVVAQIINQSIRNLV